MLRNPISYNWEEREENMRDLNVVLTSKWTEWWIPCLHTGFVIHYKVGVFFCLYLQVRVQAIRGLPLFCKDTPEHIAKIVDILVQLLAAGLL